MHRLKMWALATLVLVLAGSGASFAQSVPSGSYQQSCKDVEVRLGVLVASCQDTSGNYQFAFLRDFASCRGDIGNQNGELVCLPGSQRAWRGRRAGLPTGSYTQTCQNARMNADNLEASCQAANGRWRQTSLPNVSRCHGDIVNEDGVLRCSFSETGYAAGPSYPPYTESCRDIRQTGDSIQATCRRNNGDWHDTSLSGVSGCGGQIINDDGVLRCLSGYAGQPGPQPSDVAYNTGYQDGLKEGGEDLRTGHSFRPHEHAAWQDADHNLSTVQMDKQQYKDRYRQGYEQGYQEAYSQTGSQADVAYNTGYEDGLKLGAEDRRTGHSFRPHEHAAWQDADHNLSTVHMDKQDYKNRYRQGYEKGYQEGYGR